MSFIFCFLFVKSYKTLLFFNSFILGCEKEDISNLEIAYNSGNDGKQRLSTIYNYTFVPKQTLRDRKRKKISWDAHVGFSTIFIVDGKKALMDHIKCMRCIGYENNKVGIQSLGRDYTVSLRKNIKGKDSSMGPYSAIDGFMDFWADCGILKFQNHNHLR